MCEGCFGLYEGTGAFDRRSAMHDPGTVTRVMNIRYQFPQSENRLREPLCHPKQTFCKGS